VAMQDGVCRMRAFILFLQLLLLSFFAVNIMTVVSAFYWISQIRCVVTAVVKLLKKLFADHIITTYTSQQHILGERTS